TILTGMSDPLGPGDQLISTKGLIPIYHLHGLRTHPNSIIIAQEDYVSLFRPNEYRQIKLALTLKESTTLLLGYGLGDVNVLTALDWSNNVFKGGEHHYPNDVIQVVWKNPYKQEPYRDKNNILIMETDDLSKFFEEYIAVRNIHLTEQKKADEIRLSLIEELINPSQEVIKKFIDNEPYRKQTLSKIASGTSYFISGFIPFLDKCLEETWVRSKPSGAFEGYNQNLSIILDILTIFDINNMPPALFQAVAYGLQRISPYIGDHPGESWEAAETWGKRKAQLKPKMIIELRNYAKQEGYLTLKSLLKE
ncbi:MAG: SIR2 family protein, partial [bacterium]|nr:SIR2 family protein [bacterium]